MSDKTSEPPVPEGLEERRAFIDPRDLPKTKLADGTVVTGSRKMVRMKKSRLGRNYNGRHRD